MLKTQQASAKKSDKFGQYLTGAQILLESLREEGVDKIFGYPGGVILSVYEALYHCEFLEHFLVRHEQAAVHAAEGYARITGKPGVALVTSGPGATNTITGIANAYLDGYPMVVFTGQVATSLIGNDAFQEADISGITRPCCKHNYLVKDVKDLQRVIKEAFHIASTGKPGPVVVDLPKDILTDSTKFNYPQEVHLPSYNPTYNGHPIQITKAFSLLRKAKKPIIIAGGGVVASDCYQELREVAKAFHIPVTTTLMGIGTFPAQDELGLGMLGMHGTYPANQAVHNSDVVFALGVRFSDRITGLVKQFCPNAKVVHVDIDPCSISKNVHVDVPIVGDAGNVLRDMLQIFANEEKVELNLEAKKEWISQINEWKKMVARPVVKSDKLSPQDVIEAISRFTKGTNTIVATEVGQHQMWTAQLYNFQEPRKLVTSGGLGTMGFGFPAAMGAAVADPSALVLNIAGDGSIQMNIQELATCVQYQIPVKVCIMNNGYLGMVRQWQEKLFDKHYSHTQISSPDYVKLAEAYGALGIRVTKTEEIEPALKMAFETDGPVFLDFIVEPFEMVYPWVLAGAPINQVLMSNDD